ncbi:MAG: glycosyltransferase [Candidatus Omnitrophica bacterium]|nr:glycosyltransferase [Candidatus Omnitrophota bacterium]
MGKLRKICNLLAGRNNWSIPFRACDLKERLKLISPEEERKRIQAGLKKRREKNEIPVNFPDRPKIFIAVKPMNWEKTGLVDSWQEVAEVIHYDWGEQYGQYNRRDWQKTGKYLFNEELVERVKSEHLKQPVQIFFSYLSGRTVFSQTIKQISEMGIITINIGFDDTRSFLGKKRRAGWTGNAEIAPAFDICITCQNRNDIVKYLKTGANPIFFPPGGNHRFWASNSLSPNRTIPISFIGQNYGRREKIVNKLRKAGMPVTTYGKGWPEGEISREKMREVYHNSLITLGFGYISNTNLLGLKGLDFEIPLTGTAYLTTYYEELAHYFVPDKEMIFYVNEEDLLQKVRYCLEHPERAKEVGLAGRKKALAEHTWEKRWQEILEVCR